MLTLKSELLAYLRVDPGVPGKSFCEFIGRVSWYSRWTTPLSVIGFSADSFPYFRQRNCLYATAVNIGDAIANLVRPSIASLLRFVIVRFVFLAGKNGVRNDSSICCSKSQRRCDELMCEFGHSWILG
ncbi:hypothetical protein [Aporhodopirellula aestuarii]|uniref:Uncharacterized protein n=1 Tax=Aporhodopirellula aestuarii TaxID=2950107 RepID=A0ABT0UDU0_9BACT|nr:hypothetical protein [Aporhodopirellula aestuarii]MCM2375223.1 hypothetical protein [Aporhodopirellula aestuarii]